MATKKKVTHTPKKRKASLTQTAKKAVKKRKPARKKNMLSEMVTPERAQQSGKAILSGATGGALIHVIEKLTPASWGNGARIATQLASSFLVATVFNMPNMSAGMAGAVGYIAVDKKLLADAEEEEDLQEEEEAEFVDAEILEEMPEYLNEAGGVLMEDARGNLYSLSEDGQVQYYAPYNNQY